MEYIQTNPYTKNKPLHQYKLTLNPQASPFTSYIFQPMGFAQVVPCFTLQACEVAVGAAACAQTNMSPLLGGKKKIKRNDSNEVKGC